MSTSVLPSFSGQPAWSIDRKSMWKTRKQEAISGKQTVLADWSYPRYQWDLTYSLLRQGSGFYVVGDSFTEMAQLLGFYDARNGGFDSFLYQDADDTFVTTQGVGTGDGSTTIFPMVRAFGGFTCPVYAPDTIGTLGAAPLVYVGGVLQNSGYAITPWGTGNAAGPGQLIFNSAPAGAAAITVTFYYYWACRFVEDECDFSKFMGKRYSVKKLSFASIK